VVRRNKTLARSSVLGRVFVGMAMAGMCILVVAILLLGAVLHGAETAVVEYACDFAKDAGLKSMAFCDTSQADDVRVKDLVSRMTLQEKVSQLVNTAAGIPRLGIPAYQWWQEGLHGVAHVPFGGALPRATSFPLPILTTASFNKDLWNQIGQASRKSGHLHMRN
jgi:beta-D-xylosidase 4